MDAAHDDREAWALAYIDGVQDPARYKPGHSQWWAIERLMADEVWVRIERAVG